MANPEHLEILKQGVDAWNKWRDRDMPQSVPDLSRANFGGADLRRANLSRANFEGANLSRANLVGAQLVGANLLRVDLREAILAWANLLEADLSGANLGGANLRRAELDRANFRNALMGDCTLADVDLSSLRGLETVYHYGPSSISIDTIYRSKCHIPEAFLRGAGVPEDFILYMRSLVGKPIEFYSCFISYSSKDQEFAVRLHTDLQQQGVRCWFAPEDLKIGDKFRTRIDESIRVYDKLMIILSENSIRSAWVEKEVETAFEKERWRNTLALFPIRLDDAVMQTGEAWAADIRRSRHIGDFTRWRDHDSYQEALGRLLRDLKAEGTLSAKG